MSNLTLRLFGAFRAHDGSGRTVAGLSRRSQGLLAYLASQPDMRAERGLVADLLWSDRSEEQARASLRQELSLLRRTLPDGVLEANRQHVWLAPERVHVKTGEGDFLQGFDLHSEGFEDWLRQMRQTEKPGTAKRSPAPAARASRPSLAVLPFDEFGVGENDMFADGVVEEITSALSRVHDFHVIARQSAFALQGQRLDIPEIARHLGTEYLVEGSIRRAGERVRISVQLVQGSNGRALWSERFDDRLDDLFELQDRIASQVAGQISPNVRAAEIDRARQRMPQDRTGYELIMSAMPHFWTHRAEENAIAVSFLDQAISYDPAHPLPKALKAWALAQQCTYLWTETPKEVRQQAYELANQAADEARDHVLTLVAIGATISMVSDEIGRASSFLDHALALDPNNAWGWMRKGYLGIYSDRPDEARRAFDTAIRLSPLDPYMHNMVIGLGMTEFRDGNFEKAKEIIKHGMELGPGVQWAYRPLIAINMALGLEDEALAAARAFKEAHPGVTIQRIIDSLPPTFSLTFSIYIEGLRKAGVPET